MRRFSACDRWLLRRSCTPTRTPRGDGTDAPTTALALHRRPLTQRRARYGRRSGAPRSFRGGGRGRCGSAPGGLQRQQGGADDRRVGRDDRAEARRSSAARRAPTASRRRAFGACSRPPPSTTSTGLVAGADLAAAWRGRTPGSRRPAGRARAAATASSAAASTTTGASSTRRCSASRPGASRSPDASGSAKPNAAGTDALQDRARTTPVGRPRAAPSAARPRS